MSCLGTSWTRSVGSSFVTNFPVDTSALTRQHRSAAGQSKNGISTPDPLSRPPATLHLVDPVVQREFFEAQVPLIAAG
jgi:lysyl-tRNA synthetase, class II